MTASDPDPPPPTPPGDAPEELSFAGAYLAGGLGSVVVVAAVLLERSGGGTAALVAVAPAVVGLVLRVAWAWVATLLIVAFLQVYPDGDPLFRAPPVPADRAGFRALDLALVAGVLGYLTCQFRLLAVRRAAPADRPTDAPLARPAGPAAPGELLGAAAAAAAAVVAGQLVFLLATTFEVEPGRSPPLVRSFNNRPDSRAALAAGAALLFAGAAGLWAWYARAAGQTPDQARAYLLDVAWAESRRELSRQELWRAWGRAPRAGPVARVRVLALIVVWAALAGVTLYGLLWVMARGG